MPKKLTDEELLFASAYIKGLENRLIPMSQFDRLASADAEEFWKLLSSLGFAAEGDGGAHSYDAAVEHARAAVFETVFSVLPDANLFNFFLYPYDYLALKALLKAEVSGASAPLPGSGSFDKDELRQAVAKRVQGPMTDRMYEGMNEVLDLVARSQDTQQIDLVLDAYCFADMAESAKKSGADFLIELVRIMIDTTNLKSFLRLRKMRRGRDFAAGVFFSGGTVDPHIYTEKYQAEISEFPSLFPSQKLADLAAECGALFDESKPMGEVEKRCDNYVMSFVRETKYVPSGPAVVAAFLYAKETELKNIRIIAAGKSAGLPAEKIRERLRLTYV